MELSSQYLKSKVGRDRWGTVGLFSCYVVTVVLRLKLWYSFVNLERLNFETSKCAVSCDWKKGTYFGARGPTFPWASLQRPLHAEPAICRLIPSSIGINNKLLVRRSVGDSKLHMASCLNQISKKRTDYYALRTSLVFSWIFFQNSRIRIKKRKS